MAYELFFSFTKVIDNLFKLQNHYLFKYWRQTIYQSTQVAYKKAYFLLFDPIYLKENKSVIRDSFLAVKEFIVKSISNDSLVDNQTMNILLHLNRLIAFSFDDILSAGLRDIHQHAKFDFRHQHFQALDSWANDYVWDVSLLDSTFCWFDMFKHFLLITAIKPLRSYNIQTAFAWSWIILKRCKKFNILSGVNTLPFLPWMIEFLIDSITQRKFVNISEIETNLNQLLDFYSVKLISLLQTLELPESLNKILTQRQKKGIMLILRRGCITRKEYSKHLKVSFMTAYRDLQDLVHKNVLLKKGSNNRTVYCLNDSIKRLS